MFTRTRLQTSRARSLRQQINPAKASLWSVLKNHQLGGYKFARQVPIGPYYADFVCRSRKLVVEVDGSQHVDSDDDRQRDAFMKSEDYAVLRIWSGDVLKHRDVVCDTILRALAGEYTSDVIAPDMRYIAKHPRSGR
jgi:very-short-patch-repair endonuclease